MLRFLFSQWLIGFSRSDFQRGATRGVNAATASGTPRAIDVTHEVFAQQFSIIKANYECKVILMFVHDGVRPFAAFLREFLMASMQLFRDQRIPPLRHTKEMKRNGRNAEQENTFQTVIFIINF